jgi:pyridinium-3,5-biscarboxylic acid mononucleotide sulfurtransferase
LHEETMNNDLSPELRAKYKDLLAYLRTFRRLAVAYSGGVDSTFLLKAAKEALRRENVLGIIARSETLTPDEFEKASTLARELNFPIVAVEYSEIGIAGYSQNPVDRCYFCKKELFGRLKEVAREHGIETLADGSSFEDFSTDYRPGMRAAREIGIVSPLLDKEFAKQEIRDLARSFGLPNWNKPSAACLASRFPYGTPITREGIEQVAGAEALLKVYGFTQVRVRYYDKMARIEILPAEMHMLMVDDVRAAVVEEFKRIGFRYVTLDLQGYRTGSLNEGLNLPGNANKWD